MKLLAWNIRHGGGKRVERLVEELAAHDADVMALTEYRAGPGAALADAFRERGWEYCETSRPAGHQNGIAVFSRTPIVRARCPAVSAHRVRWLELELPDAGIGIAVLHIMAAGSGKSHPLNIEKVKFWGTVLRAAARRAGRPFLLLGDWNTGAHFADEAGKTYVCAEEFGRLSEMGWVDLWRRHNPGATEWTWLSHRKNGFRLDHAFASPPLVERVVSCRYSHREREAGVSDHSVVVVEIAGAG